MSNIDPTLFCWYRSETQLGLMHVGVATSEAERNNLQGPHCVFQQAALLSNTEVMLQAIELWQEVDLDLVPCEAPDNTSLHLSLQLNNTGNDAESVSVAASPSTEPSVQAAETENVDQAAAEAVETNEPNEQPAEPVTQTQSNTHASNKQPHIVMVFDCATLIQLKSLSQELQSVLSVTSSDVELRVKLDELSIPSDEMAMIESGAVVVIPAAYQPEWGIVAISTTPEVPLKFGGSVKKSDQSLQVQIAHHEASLPDNQVSDDETIDDSVTVWCKQLCSIPVTQLLGINASDQAMLLHKLDAAELSIVQGDSTIAYGSLLSYGRGSVFAVSERLME